MYSLWDDEEEEGVAADGEEAAEWCSFEVAARCGCSNPTPREHSSKGRMRGVAVAACSSDGLARLRRVVEEEEVGY